MWRKRSDRKNTVAECKELMRTVQPWNRLPCLIVVSISLEYPTRYCQRFLHWAGCDLQEPFESVSNTLPGLDQCSPPKKTSPRERNTKKDIVESEISGAVTSKRRGVFGWELGTDPQIRL